MIDFFHKQPIYLMLLNGLSHFSRSSVPVNCFDVDLYVAVEAVYCNMEYMGTIGCRFHRSPPAR